MANVLEFFPELRGDEQVYIAGLIKDMNEEQIRQFSIAYRSRRKDPQMILLLAAIGLLGIAGVHRFVLEQVGMGILYFLTGGICLIGTIVDMINFNKLAFEYNQVQANQILSMMNMHSQIFPS